MLQDLVRHKVWANASLLRAISRHAAAVTDDDLRRLTHHIILANRFWFAAVRGRPFDVGAESAVPTTLAGVIDQFRETHGAELTWLDDLSERALERVVESSYFPGRRISVAEAMMQVCLHSHGHRAQAATRLRGLGGAPPVMDYVTWLADRPVADWG
jgi:uncharacterized damage-inducible protein DinB